MKRHAFELSVLLTATLLGSCGNSGGPGNVETAADGNPVTKRAEMSAERLETQAVFAEEPMSGGGPAAVKAEQAGAKLDAEAAAVRSAGEAAAGAEQNAQ